MAFATDIASAAYAALCCRHRVTITATATIQARLISVVTDICFTFVLHTSSRSAQRIVLGSSASLTCNTCSPRKSNLGLSLCELFLIDAMVPTIIFDNTWRCAPSVSNVQNTCVARYRCCAKPWIRAFNTVSRPTNSGIPGDTRDLILSTRLLWCSIFAASSANVMVLKLTPSFIFSSISKTTSRRSASAFTSKSLSIVTVQHVTWPLNRLSKNSFHSSGSVASPGGLDISIE